MIQYVNREGFIVIEQDYMKKDGSGNTKPSSGITIDENNAFTYSLPVTSKNIVNRVDIEYYHKTINDDDTENVCTIKLNDLQIGADGRIYFTVKLKKLYEKIEELTEPDNAFSICKASYNSITYVLDNTVPDIDLKITVVKADGSNSWKLEKSNYLRDERDSIMKYGFKEFKCSASASMNKEQAEKNAEKILSKYKSGVAYLETNWKGNDELKVGMTFKGDKESEAAEKERQTFECLSNEMVLNGGFRTKTKGLKI